MEFSLVFVPSPKPSDVKLASELSHKLLESAGDLKSPSKWSASIRLFLSNQSKRLFLLHSQYSAVYALIRNEENPADNVVVKTDVQFIEIVSRCKNIWTHRQTFVISGTKYSTSSGSALDGDDQNMGQIDRECWMMGTLNVKGGTAPPRGIVLLVPSGEMLLKVLNIVMSLPFSQNPPIVKSGTDPNALLFELV